MQPPQNKFGAGEDSSLFFRHIHPFQPNSLLPVASLYSCVRCGWREGIASFGWLRGGGEGGGEGCAKHFEGLWREKGERDVIKQLCWSPSPEKQVERVTDQGVIPFAFNIKAIYIL